MTEIFPVSLVLQGLDVLVVGGGRVAERRVRSFLEANAHVTVIAPEISSWLTVRAEAKELRWIARGYEPGDITGFWLVQAATDSPHVNSEVAKAAHEARVFCFTGGDPANSTAWRPAITHFKGHAIAVSGGGSAREAIATRNELAQLVRTHEELT